jgi:mannitol operon repressor
MCFDRGAAISDGLGDLLRLYCVKLEENDISHLFHDRGAPLGDFATRTDVSFALGLISPQERLIANVIRRIRNVFAHTLARIEFSQELIVSELSKIAPGKSWPNSTDKKRFVELSIMLYSDLRVRGRYLKQRARLADGNSKPIYELEKQTVASRV